MPQKKIVGFIHEHCLRQIRTRILIEQKILDFNVCGIIDKGYLVNTIYYINLHEITRDN